MKRIISALIALPIVLVPLYFGGIAFYFVAWVIGALALYEWVILMQSRHATRDMAVLTALLIALTLVIEFVPAIDANLYLLAGAAVCALAAWFLRRSSFVALFAGATYIVYPFVVLVLWRDTFFNNVLPPEMSGEANALLILYILVSVWLTDIGGLVFGKTIGQTDWGGAKLAPATSPNKTWAGLGGAALAAMLVPIVLVVWAYIIAPNVAPQFYVLFPVAVMLALVAQAGDLFESALKRKQGMKDSGSIMPGHGGVLDRIDGLLAVVIALHVVLTLAAFV